MGVTYNGAIPNRNPLRHVVVWNILYIIIYITLLFYITYYTLYIIQGVPGVKINILGGHSIFILGKKVLKIVHKEEILRTVSNIGIYCSSDKVRTVYLVQYIFQNSTAIINAR